jgi:general secretion pathway protein A
LNSPLLTTLIPAISIDLASIYISYMYESYFKLKEKPFSISPDPRFIYLTAQHQEALAKVQYAISQRMGVSAIYGDIGAGKTSLARRLWVLYADNPNYNFAMIVHPNFPSTFQFVKEIRREFGLDKPPRSLSDALDEFQDFLLTEHSKGKTNILVIDEAQNLKPSNYETLRQLLNFETNTQKLLQIALFGQNELASKIDRQPELKDRITLFGALTNLTFEDALALIDFRWKVAGGGDHPFDKDALEAIFKYSKGLPRKISKIADNALIRAMSSEATSIDKEIIEQVASEVRLTEEFEYTSKSRGTKSVKKK